MSFSISKICLLTSLLFISLHLAGQNMVPTITNLSASVDANYIVNLTYDLADMENEDCEIRLRISDDNGNTFTIDGTNATGDVGFPVTPGMGKQISWDHTNIVDTDGDFQFKLIADDRLGFDIQELVDQVDSNRLLTDLQFLEGPRHWITGNAHVLEVQDSLENFFNGLNLAPEIFTFPKGNYVAKNIVGNLDGVSDIDSIYIIDGHYDTVSNAPGVDDNGSAVAGFMEAARILSQYEFHRTIKFIGFDLEEDGLTGSLDYVQNSIPDHEFMKGVFNLEMIGYATDEPNTQELPTGFELLFSDVYNEVAANEFRGDFITNVGYPKSVEIMNAFDLYASTYVPDLSVITVEAPGSWLIVTPDLGRSDHAPFWLDNRSAVMLTDGADFRNPNYHESTDDLSTINFEFMTNVVKAVVATVAELAIPAHASSASTNLDLVADIHSFNCIQSIAPNPANDILTIQLDDCAAGNILFQLVAADGKLVLDKKFDNPSMVNLNVSEIPAGIYFLHLFTDEASAIEKIVIE